jgi:hypothetical protein
LQYRKQETGKIKTQKNTGNRKTGNTGKKHRKTGNRKQENRKFSKIYLLISKFLFFYVTKLMNCSKTKNKCVIII